MKFHILLALAMLILPGMAAEPKISISQINGTELDIAYARAYGVIPDDGLDDSAALQAALDSGIRIVQLPGGVIDVVNTTIDIPGDTELRGTGRATTELNMTGTLSKLVITANRVTIRDMFLNSTDYTSLYGIEIDTNVHYWDIEDCWIKGFAKNGDWTCPGAGIYIKNSAWIGRIENVLIDSCFLGVFGEHSLNAIKFDQVRANDNTQDGIYLESRWSHGIIFTGCSVEGNGRTGITLANVDQALIEGCYIELNEYSGIFLTGTSATVSSGIISIIGNTLYENGKNNSVPSIECWKVNRTLISGNRFAGNHSEFGAIRLSGDPLSGSTDLKVATLIENRYDEMTGAGAGVYVTNPQYAVIIDSRRNGGTTAHRPAAPSKYEIYFDSTLGKPIVYTGSAWVKMDGTPL